MAVEVVTNVSSRFLFLRSFFFLSCRFLLFFRLCSSLVSFSFGLCGLCVVFCEKKKKNEKKKKKEARRNAELNIF
jgi:hypothetical protein